MSEYNVQQQQDEDEIVIDLRVLFCDLWKGLKKLWWVFLILCSLMAGMNYVQSAVRYAPMYESKISFTVSTQTGYDETNTSYGFYYNQSTAEQMANLFPYILQSDVMQGLIKEELGTEFVNGNIIANAVPNSNLFTMKVTSSDATAAKQILEATMKHLPDVTKYVIGETKLNIIQPATTPEVSYNKPSYRRKVVKGFLVGVVVSCVILGIYALFRKTIRREEDFREVLNMKCLGVVPQVKFKAHKQKIDRSISILNDKTGRPFRESVRSLSLKLERRMKEKGQKVILVTSTLPDEGKSTVAMNLAMNLAEKGKKVLLIDMDFRNPTLAKNLKASFKTAGLEQIMAGTASPELGVQKLSQGIFFMGGQKASKNVSNLLTKPILRKIIQKCREQMDYIILDAAPCGAISDAATISEVCDGILYVIRQDEAKQGQIIDGIQQVTSHGTPILGGVLNGVESSLSGYGYHYYGYGYGRYGYGKYGYGKYGYGKYGGYGYGQKTGRQKNS